MAIAPYQWDEQIPASNRMGALEPQPTIAPGILAQAIKKPGFFDGGGTGSKIGSFILEALTGIPSAAHREQGFQRQLSQYGQKSMLEQQLEQHKWQQQQDYERANPKPYNFQANNGDQMQIGPDGQPRMVYKDPTPKIDWIMAEDPATGIKSLVPKPQMMAPAAGPPPGVTFTPRAGGAGPQAPRTFR